MLLDVGGQDATEAFEDVGHSDEAREILEGLLVGTLKRQVRKDGQCPKTHKLIISSPETQHPRLLLPPPPRQRQPETLVWESVSTQSFSLAALLPLEHTSTYKVKKARHKRQVSELGCCSALREVYLEGNMAHLHISLFV